MIKIESPISILEFGSTKIGLAIYDKSILNQSLFYEKKIEYTRNQKFIEENSIVNIISRAEKDIGQHLNEILLIIDSSSIGSIDFSIQKNYDKKLVLSEDIDYLIKECVNIVKSNNKEKEILHTIKCNIIFDGQVIESLEKISQEVSKVTLELKFILIDKKNYNLFKDLFLKRHISINNIFCSSYIKTLGLIKEKRDFWI
jgi:Actin-like ATPase involved in cell division